MRARATTIGSLWDALIDAECLDDVLHWPSNDPAAAMTGTLLGIAFEERVVAEVRADRSAPEVLDTLQIF